MAIAKVMGWPMAAHSRAAMRGACDSRRVANLSMVAARLEPGSAHHCGKAFLAAATAASTSCSDATWTLSVTSSSVLGLWIVRVSPVEEGTYSLLMKRFVWRSVLVMLVDALACELNSETDEPRYYLGGVEAEKEDGRVSEE